MQEVLLSMLGVACAFTLLTVIHEGGHFLAAKAVGLHVEEFAVGLGPKIFSRKFGTTEYSLRAIPIGGFNRMPGMNPGEEQQPGFFYAVPVWKRQVVVLAGALANFILAACIITVIYCFIPTTQHLSLPETVWAAVGRTTELVVYIGKLMISILLRGDVEQLAGPIGIVQAISATTQAGLLAFSTFLALFSINIGVFNLLPFPLLDGGHVVLGCLETLIGRRPSVREMKWIQKSGLGLIGALLLVGTFQDLLRIFSQTI